jgi:PEGA domain
MIDGGAVEAARLRAVREAVAHYRSVIDPAPLPAQGTASPEQVAVEQRAQAVRLALERARKRESEALWDDCVREAAGVMSDAIEVMAATGDLALLRELHLQTGVCMSLANQAPGARTHFLAAALFDESPPPAGLHREEAEVLQAESRKEVLSRPRGSVRIVTDPPGARVLIDGREMPGTTPLEADIRLGDHFVTIRRFRFEPNTEQRLLQPFGLVRVSLEPARRTTLAEQLAAVQAPPRDELELALAQWSRAEQLIVATPQQPASSGYKLSLVETGTGKSVRTTAVSASADGAAVRRSVCEVLGESCEVSRGIPWYVWPLAGAVVVGGVVTTGVILENNRDTRFCPPAGCR